MQENIPAGVEPQSPLPAMAAAGGQGPMPHRGGSSPVVNGTSPGSKSPSVLLPVAPPDPSLLGGRSQDFVKLFVGSVPRNATEDEIRDLFGEYGNLVEVAVIKNKATGLSQGCAFVKYATIEDAERAIRSVNNMRCLPGNTVPVQVRFADGERERLGSRVVGCSLSAGGFSDMADSRAIEHKLFVGSVSRHAGEAEVKELFCQYGHVEDVYIMRDENKQSKGCCFVKYSNRESAMNAINALNGLYTMEGSDQPLAVRFADPKKPKGAMEMQGFGGPGFRPRGSPFMSRGGMQGGRGMGSMDGGRPHMWRGPMGGPGIGHMGPGGPMGGPMGPRMMAGPMGGLAGPMGGQGGQMGGPVPMGGAGPLGHHGPMGAPAMIHPAQAQQQPQQPGMQQPMPLMMGGPGAGVMPMMQQQQQAQGYYQPPPQQAVEPQQQQPQPQPQQQMPQHMQQQMAQGIQQQMPQQMQQQSPLQPQPMAPPQQYIPPTCDWSEHTAPEGYKYYYNSVSGVSQWEKPPELTAFEQAQQQMAAQQQMPPQQQQHQLQQTPQQQGMPIVYPGAQMVGQATMQYAQQHQGGMQGMEARPNQIQGPPGANLFVFRIPDDFTDENLTQTFTPFGNVISARIGVEKESGRNRGFGFVSFDNAASAEKAIQQLNGVTIGGRRLKVERKRGEENGSVGYRPY